MQNIIKHKSNKNVILTLIGCLCFILSLFFYTINHRITNVAAIDTNKYHQAVDTYMNTETYHN